MNQEQIELLKEITQSLMDLGNRLENIAEVGDDPELDSLVFATDTILRQLTKL